MGALAMIGRKRNFFSLAGAILILVAGCGSPSEELETVDYAPLARDDWPVSTPEEQELDPDLVAKALSEPTVVVVFGL